MNEFDLERMHESLRIAEVARVNSSSWSATQNEFTVDVGSKVNGTYRDTQEIDTLHESFIEGSSWWNSNYAYRKMITVVNYAASALDTNNSASVTMDTTSLVSSGKVMPSGNDLRIAYLAGGSWIELDREVRDMNTNFTQVSFRIQTPIEPNSLDSGYHVYYGNPNAGNPPANRSNIYLWFDDFNRTDKPDITTEAFYQVKTGGGTWSIENGSLKNVGASGDPNKLIVTALGNVRTNVDMLVRIKVASFAGGDTSRMGLSCCMDTSPSRGSGYCALFHDDSTSLDLLNDLRSWGTYGTYSWSLNTWYYMRFTVVDPAIRLGKVKAWPLGTAEPSVWTVEGNFGSGSARSIGEVGFAGSRTSDTTYFDDIVIRYVTSPEPSTSLGPEESQASKRLEIDGTFNIDVSTYPLNRIQTVEILMKYKASDAGEKWFMKAYNWTSSNYDDHSFNSTAGDLPTTEWNSYALNLTDQFNSYVNSNGTIYVKIFDNGVDPNQTTIDVDFVALKAIIDGAKFTFVNNGTFTSHIVALWIIDSKEHQRYKTSIFINSADTFSYYRTDISLPKRPYAVKVVTERGNIAVFSSN